MFKKLKDKIGEEFKQAPLKFPVSVQQLAQVSYFINFMISFVVIRSLCYKFYKIINITVPVF